MRGLNPAEQFSWELKNCQDVFDLLTMPSWSSPVDLQFGKFIGKDLPLAIHGH
jgi:hypothetical protein